MTLSPADWHNRFSLQARWTHELRQHLYLHADLEHATRVLDVGCGTGALQSELDTNTQTQVHGLDIDARFLVQAARNNPSGFFTLADAHSLPYPSASFDITLCHFLLMWVKSPSQVLMEMRRVTRPGGALMALAEPDYGGRIDHPAELAQIGRMQMESLDDQGAEPEMGRRLAGLFSDLGLENVETGVLGGQWSGSPHLEELASEWAVIRSDLSRTLSEEQLDGLQEMDAHAWGSGTRVLFVPTFYAWGRAPHG